MPLPDDTRRSRVVVWIRQSWRAVVAEVISTALLMWFGLGSCTPYYGDAKKHLTHTAFAFGFIVTGNAVVFGPASGAHMNPAVTLAAVLYGRIRVPLALAYCAAQMAGALLGFYTLMAVTPAQAARATVGCTVPAPDMTALAATAVEAALTGMLVLGCCASWTDPKEDPTASIKLGLLVAGLIFAGGYATGASLNPARSFAPAAYHGYWDSHWVYWVGPLAGAVLAVILHRYMLTSYTPAPSAPRAAPEEVPLNDKP